MSNCHLTKKVGATEPNSTISSIFSQIIRKHLKNRDTKLNLAPMLQQILLDENLTFFRVCDTNL